MISEIMVVAGTRAEAIKIAPVVLAMRRDGRVAPVVVTSGQHREGTHQVLREFGIDVDVDLKVRRRNGTQAELVGAIAGKLGALLTRRRPAAVVVQGDTSTGLAAALAAFWDRVPVVHLEAGLRTHRVDAPFPEEANRQMIARIASLHLAPHRRAAENLLSENINPRDIVVTGNTTLAAAGYIARSTATSLDSALRQVSDSLATKERLVLATLHRRESWGEPLRRVLSAILDVVADHPDVRLLFPMHPNPALSHEATAVLGGHQRVWLTAPLGYASMVWALRRTTMAITDSGGLQEECAVFGVPVLITREVTERVDSVSSGVEALVGTDPKRIRSVARTLLADGSRALPADVPCDDEAAGRVVDAVVAMLKGVENPPLTSRVCL